MKFPVRPAHDASTRPLPATICGEEGLVGATVAPSPLAHPPLPHPRLQIQIPHAGGQPSHPASLLTSRSAGADACAACSNPGNRKQGAEQHPVATQLQRQPSWSSQSQAASLFTGLACKASPTGANALPLPPPWSPYSLSSLTVTPPWSPSCQATEAFLAAIASPAAPLSPSNVAVRAIKLQATSYQRPGNTPTPGPRSGSSLSLGSRQTSLGSGSMDSAAVVTALTPATVATAAGQLLQHPRLQPISRISAASSPKQAVGQGGCQIPVGAVHAPGVTTGVAVGLVRLRTRSRTLGSSSSVGSVQGEFDPLRLWSGTEVVVVEGGSTIAHLLPEGWDERERMHNDAAAPPASRAALAAQQADPVPHALLPVVGQQQQQRQ